MKVVSCFLTLLLLHTAAIAQQTKAPQQFTITANPADAGFDVARLQRLDQYVQAFIDSGNVPNAVIFVARHGKVVYHKAFGFSNREQRIPARTTDIFRIASQTKAIASVTLMTLFEEGRFLLDDPISKYIPAFKNTQVLVRYDTLNPLTGAYQTRPAKSQITIRQLLAHNAGVPYGHPLENRPEFKVPFLGSMEPEKLEDVINKLAIRPLIADPGDGFVYGLNTDIIGRLIEVLSGQPLDVAIRQRVTAPLGMNDTYFYLPSDKKDRLVALYTKGKAGDAIAVHSIDLLKQYPVAGAQTYFSAGAGMVSTALDYGRFCQMLLNGGTFNNKRILSQQTIILMTRNQIGDAEVWDRQDKFGLGFQIVTDKTHYADMASPGSFGWGGVYCSDYLIDPKQGLVIQTFTNIWPFVYCNDFNQKLKILIYQAL